MTASIADLSVVPILLFSAWFVEKLFVSRVAVLPNVLVIVLPYSSDLQNVPQIMLAWLIVDIFVGILMLPLYVSRIRIPTLVYGFVYMLYSMKTVLGIYLGALLDVGAFGTVLGVLLSVGLWYI